MANRGSRLNELQFIYHYYDLVSRAFKTFYLQSISFVSSSSGAITIPDDIGFVVTILNSELLAFGWRSQQWLQQKKYGEQHFFSPLIAHGNEVEFPIIYWNWFVLYIGFMASYRCYNTHIWCTQFFLLINGHNLYFHFISIWMFHCSLSFF